MRCPKCGNEVRNEDFTCIYCGAILQTESIDKIPIFKRVDEKWVEPGGGSWKRLFNVFLNPSRVFWDIKHYRSKIGGNLVYILSALLFALQAVAATSHIRVTSVNGNPITFYNQYLLFFDGLALFLQAFLFGLIYYAIFYWFAIKLFSLGANYSINFSKQIEAIYGSIQEEDKSKTKTISEGGYMGVLPEYLTGEKSKKSQILRMAFAPLLIAQLIVILLNLILIPNVSVDINYYSGLGIDVLRILYNKPLLIATNIVYMVFLIGWVPITMSIAIRELVNASTLRVYISSLIVGIILAVLFFAFRPSFAPV